MNINKCNDQNKQVAECAPKNEIDAYIDNL